MRSRYPALLVALLFLVAGLWWIGQPGIQADEALFASILFDPPNKPVTFTILGHRFPAMAFHYIGALKSGIASMIFGAFGVSMLTIRGPFLLAGALTLYLYMRLLQTFGGVRLSIAAGVLMAADSTFFFTTQCDFGPVVLQRLAAVSVCLAAHQFFRSGSTAFAVLAGLCAGLGVWDKVTFVWIGVALVTGAIVSMMPALRERLTLRAAAAAFVGFLAGCYPLLVFFYKTSGQSVRTFGELQFGYWPAKALHMLELFGGFPLFGSNWTPLPGARLVLAFALILAPKFWSSRLYRFALSGAIAGYAAMFAFRDGGWGAHHASLLWPLLYALIAAVLVHLPVKLAGPLFVATLASNVWNTGQERLAVLHGDIGVEWSDATATLAHRLKGTVQPVVTLDWGIFDSLWLLTGGDILLHAEPGGDWSNSVYVTHAEEVMIHRDRWPSFVAESGKRGLRPQVIETIPTSAGKPGYVLYRLQPIELTQPPQRQ